MYNSSGLIPAKFLTLIAHFVVCISLLWSPSPTVIHCLKEEATEKTIQEYHTQLVIGLSVAIAMICFEVFVFIIGLTIFHSTSALLSISCHASACILLSHMILNGWQCGWFWYIFAFGSTIPALYDICIVTDVLVNSKY